jgi:hypothetical protein
VRPAFTNLKSTPRVARGRLVSVSRSHWALLAILAGTLAVDLPSFGDYFHGDDFLAFVDLVSKPPLRFLGEVLAFEDSNFYWRPLGQVYYLLIYNAFGLDALAFSIANLLVFAVTIALLYAFCLKAGFGKPVAVGAAAFFAFFPNHAVSVAWITNAPRLLAAMFFLASLLAIDRGIVSGRRRFEVLAVLLFTLSVLSDEVALALAPVLFLYALWREGRQRGWLRRAAVRAVFIGAAAGFFLPLNYLLAADSHSEVVRFGGHVPRQAWALVSKLVLPIQDGTGHEDILDAQWVAGAAAIALAAVFLIAGSARLRILVVWMACALAPFSLWLVPIAPPRYVYLAAMPLAITVSWAAVTILTPLLALRPRLPALGAVPAGLALAALLVAAAALPAGGVTAQRNAAYGRQAEPYRELAQGLPAALRDVPKGGRIIIYYGVWKGFVFWPEAVLRTVYKDPALKVLNLDYDAASSATLPIRKDDRVVYYTPRGFIAAPASTTQTAPPAR